jgi:hypothetical protein
MTRFATRIVAALTSALALVGITTTSAFARVLPPESATGAITASDTVSGTALTTAPTSALTPIPWLFAGALIAFAVMGLYLVATALVHRTRTPSVG